MFCSPVSNEYFLVATHFGLGRKELGELSLQSVEAVFSEEDDKEELRKRIRHWVESNVEGNIRE